MALIIFEINHPWCRVIKFSSYPSLHSSYTTTDLLPLHCSPWLPHILAQSTSHCWASTCSCSLLSSTTVIPSRFMASNISLTIKMTSHKLYPLFNTKRRPLGSVLEDQKYRPECYCCLPCSEVLFLKLFCLFISHVFTSFTCSGLFLLLNESWCFTWRKAFFSESCRAFRTQFACKKSQSKCDLTTESLVLRAQFPKICQHESYNLWLIQLQYSIWKKKNISLIYTENSNLCIIEVYDLPEPEQFWYHSKWALSRAMALFQWQRREWHEQAVISP